MNKEILRLTQFWYKYVSLGHHKDRDCHFYIKETWSYGDPPTYSIGHEGYIAHDDDIYDMFRAEYKTHKEAERALVDFLVVIILRQKEWAKEVLSKPKDWDGDQIKMAKLVSRFQLDK